MSEDGVHFVFLQHLIQLINLQVFPTDCEVVGDWIELNSVDWLLHLELFHHLISAIIDDIQPSLFPTRKYVVSFAGYSVDI